MFTTTDTSYTVVTDLQYTYTFSSTGDKQIRTEKSTLMLFDNVTKAFLNND